MKKTVNPIIKFLRKFSIRFRLNAVYTVITASILLISGILINYYANLLTFDQSDQFTQSYIEQLIVNMDSIIDQNTKALINAATDVKLYDAVNDYYDQSIEEQYKRTAIIRTFMNNVRENTNKFCGAEVCTLTQRIASLQTPITTGDIQTSNILKKINETNDIEYFGTIKLENDYPTKMLNKYSVITVPIQSRSAGEPAGWFSVAFSEILLNQIINSDRFDNTTFYIADSDGTIISDTNKNLLGQKENPEITKLSSDKNNTNVNTVTIENKKYCVNYAFSKTTNWKIVALTDYRSLSSTFTKIMMNAVFPLMAFIILIVMFLIIISRSIINPINQVVHQMENISDEIIAEPHPIIGNDEITYMEREFVNMTIRIQTLIKQTKLASEKQAKAQLKALQAQISPHFLYNTLDTVNWMAYMAENYEVCDIVNQLSTFFRISLNFGKDIFTIRDELMHVDCYCKIQKHRFGESLNFNFDIDESTYDFKILKIVLQPLVENAISHGLSPKNYTGTISVSVKKQDQNLYLRVTDDGVGLDYWKTHTQPISKHSGYGISNINDRLKLYYGNQYGLTLSDNHPSGTIAEICIPALEEERNFD